MMENKLMLIGVGIILLIAGLFIFNSNNQQFGFSANTAGTASTTNVSGSAIRVLVSNSGVQMRIFSNAGSGVIYLKNGTTTSWANGAGIAIYPTSSPYVMTSEMGNLLTDDIYASSTGATKLSTFEK